MSDEMNELEEIIIENPTEIGPFTEFDLKGIVEILETKGVVFEIVQDEEMYDEQHREYKERHGGETKSNGQKFSPSYLFLEVDTKDLEKVQDYIAKYLGVV
jgi:hypothetical protein